MDCVAVALQAPEEAEGEDADGEADEGHHDPDSSDDGQKQLVPHVVTLRGIKDKLWITNYLLFFQRCEECLQHFMSQIMWPEQKHQTSSKYCTEHYTEYYMDQKTYFTQDYVFIWI